MFQYVKTLGAYCGAPEAEYLPIDNYAEIEEGCLCEMYYGLLSSEYNESKFKSKFITLEKKTPGDGKTKVKCIRVLPGMIISVDYSGEIASISVGTFVSPVSDSQGYYLSCQENTAGSIEVVDKSEYATTGKIQVIIHC